MQHSRPFRSLLAALGLAVGAPAVIGLAQAGATSAPLERAAAPVPASTDDDTDDATELALPVVTTIAAPTTTTTSTTTTTTTVAPVVAPSTAAPTTTAPPPPPPPPPAPTTTTTTTAPPPQNVQAGAAPGPGRDPACEADLLAWSNERRSALGVAAFVDDEGIRSIPVDWTQSMSDAGELEHNPHFGDQIFGARPQARTAGENVGRSGGGSARAVFDEFIRSDGHRSKIDGTSYSHVSIGCVRDTSGGVWVTMNFWG